MVHCQIVLALLCDLLVVITAGRLPTGIYLSCGLVDH